MGSRRTSFDKLQRDRAKKAKAAAKRDRRTDRDAPAVTGDPDAVLDDAVAVDDGGELSAADLLKRIESVHRRFEAGTISYDEFEEEKADLLARLPID